MNIDAFSMDYFSLKGKNAIIVGGNLGLGLSFSLALAKAGANVFIPSLIDEDGAARELLEKENVRAAFMLRNVSQKDAPRQIIEACVETFGSVDILVNGSGICHLADMLEFDRAPWDTMVAINLTAAFEMCHEAAKVMIPKKSGKIINICSVFSFLGGQGSPAYAATKHGLAGLTKAYCDELGQYNIQVNGLAPGYYTRDPSVPPAGDQANNQRILEHIPAGRWGEYRDIMGALVFLASRASDYISGHILTVDGGYLVR